MAYDLFDLTESVNRVGVERSWVDRVALAFGKHGDMEEWEGGFLLCGKQTNGAPLWAFVFGWCDTTGWGCQDGAYLRAFDSEPGLVEIAANYATQMSYDLRGVVAKATDWDWLPAATARDLDADSLAESLVRAGKAVEEVMLFILAQGDGDPADLNRWANGETS